MTHAETLRAHGVQEPAWLEGARLGDLVARAGGDPDAARELGGWYEQAAAEAFADTLERRLDDAVIWLD